MAIFGLLGPFLGGFPTGLGGHHTPTERSQLVLQEYVKKRPNPSHSRGFGPKNLISGPILVRAPPLGPNISAVWARIGLIFGGKPSWTNQMPQKNFRRDPSTCPKRPRLRTRRCPEMGLNGGGPKNCSGSCGLGPKPICIPKITLIGPNLQGPARSRSLFPTCGW